MDELKLIQMLGERGVLVARREQLLQEQRALDEQMASLSGFIRQWHYFAAGDFEKSIPEKERVGSTSGRVNIRHVGRKENSRIDDVVDCVVSLIEKAGKPLSTAELLEGVSQVGLVVRGAKPTSVLYTMLFRSPDRVVRTDDARWDVYHQGLSRS